MPSPVIDLLFHSSTAFAVHILGFAGVHYGNNGNFELLRKLEIASVMCGHSHDGAGAVTDEDIIRNPYRDWFAINWIH